MTLLGLVSDTHGLLRPQVLEKLRGVDRIVHAGDVGDPTVVDRLEKMAPCTVVRGNVDRGAWAEKLPLCDTLVVENVTIHVVHAIDDLDLVPEAAGIDLVVFGHSHRPSSIERGGVLYVNPGSIGPRRFRLPISMALAEIEGRSIRVRHVEIDA